MNEQVRADYNRSLSDFNRKRRRLEREYDNLVVVERDCRFGIGKAAGLTLQERRSILNHAKLAHASALRKANRSKEIYLAAKRACGK